MNKTFKTVKNAPSFWQSLEKNNPPCSFIVVTRCGDKKPHVIPYSYNAQTNTYQSPHHKEGISLEKFQENIEGTLASNSKHQINILYPKDSNEVLSEKTAMICINAGEILLTPNQQQIDMTNNENYMTDLINPAYNFKL